MMRAHRIVLGLAACAAACSEQTPSYPLLGPSVKSAAPVGLGGSASTSTSTGAGKPAAGATIDLSDFKGRFFTAGPTSVFGLIDEVDGRIADLNRPTRSTCIDQAPVAYAIHPPGAAVTMYAQCYVKLSAPAGGAPGFIQWALTDDGRFYLWVAVGDGQIAAIATPSAASGAAGDAGIGSGLYAVQMWASVGGASCEPWDSCSYVAMQLSADATRASLVKSFEMAVAGLGVGYCGLQLVSDGTHIFGEGSLDMGDVCNATATVCTDAKNVGVAATCTAAEQVFALAPLGRREAQGTSRVWAASDYPGGAKDTVVLDGAAGDAVHFGPTAPTSGVGAY